MYILQICRNPLYKKGEHVTQKSNGFILYIHLSWICINEEMFSFPVWYSNKNYVYFIYIYIYIVYLIHVGWLQKQKKISTCVFCEEKSVIFLSSRCTVLFPDECSMICRLNKHLWIWKFNKYFLKQNVKKISRRYRYTVLYNIRITKLMPRAFPIRTNNNIW